MLAACLCPGMGFTMYPLQALAAHVGIDLCRTQIRVTQKLLHSTKIGTSIQKMSREGVS